MAYYKFTHSRSGDFSEAWHPRWATVPTAVVVATGVAAVRQLS